METITIKVIADPEFLPVYATAQAAGMDLHACIEAPIVLKPGERKLLPTGIKMALPPGYEAQIRPRSGLALKHGITVLNSPGTIDADYRGEVGVILYNAGQEDFEVTRGMRIAQMVISTYVQVKMESVTALSETGRGEGGFGHSGC